MQDYVGWKYKRKNHNDSSDSVKAYLFHIQRSNQPEAGKEYTSHHLIRFYRASPSERNRLYDEYYAEMNFTSFENPEMLLNQ